MKAIHNYLLAMVGDKTFSSQKELLEYTLRCAAEMKEDLVAFIFSFNESERQRVIEIIKIDLLEKAKEYKNTNVGAGFISCMLGLQSEINKFSLDEKKISLDVNKEVIELLNDPLKRSLYFDAKEEKTPGETNPQERPGETIPQETPGETIPQETPGETIPKKKPGRPPKTVLEVIIYKDKEIAFEVLKECLGGKKGVDLAYLVEAAILLGLIKEPPSFSAMKEELGVTGWPNGFDKPFKDIHKPKSSSAQTISRKMDYAKRILEKTLDRKQNNHGNN